VLQQQAQQTPISPSGSTPSQDWQAMRLAQAQQQSGDL
jgi:hypothetical protein